MRIAEFRTVWPCLVTELAGAPFQRVGITASDRGGADNVQNQELVAEGKWPQQVLRFVASQAHE
jgi:hypothetical protein